LLERTPSSLELNKYPEELGKYDGANINNKSTKKKKILFVFPGQLNITCNGGKLGTLDKMSSKNPVLYVEYPQGRLKLFGTIVYPKNTFLALSYKKNPTKSQKTKVGLQCSGSFDAYVVFCDYKWIGTKKENPSEKSLDIPKDLLKAQADSEDDVKEVSIDPEVEDEDGNQESSEGSSEGVVNLCEEDEILESTPEPTRRSGRIRGSATKVSYKEKSDSEPDEEEEDGDDDEEEEEEEEESSGQDNESDDDYNP